MQSGIELTYIPDWSLCSNSISDTTLGKLALLPLPGNNSETNSVISLYRAYLHPTMLSFSYSFHSIVLSSCVSIKQVFISVSVHTLRHTTAELNTYARFPVY